MRSGELLGKKSETVDEIMVFFFNIWREREEEKKKKIDAIESG